ncbi:Aste57867_23562 [Aphanomyces stellatus]|uniref:Aste57867_23562 protein n=1 Tax=Aphanomyces stellatus TaxID=120398 RepID=A0A485LN80_9STRA|nr:hypothetical protein As57867_023491 [Aphanomyces stellatus]VFU00207.1 Aste57867_23562 [Aphanomyces stellatus]
MSENAPPSSLGVDAADGASLDIITVSKTLLDNFDLPANRVCMVCFDGAEYPSNPLLCCSVDTCRIRVHLACYGSATGSKPLMSYKKRSKWVCDACVVEKQANALKPNAERECTVCKMGGGALKPTKSPDKVCHLVCVRWLPELKQVPLETHPASSFVDADLLYGTRKSLKCIICQKRNGCFQCMGKRCTKAFHAICALRALESKVYTGCTETNQLACFCDAHFGEIRATYRSIKDVFWNQPYAGPEVDDDDDDDDEMATPLLPSPLGSTTPSPLSMMTQSPMMPPVMPFSQPPTPKKVGRPKKDAPKYDPSAPKPTLPLPPGQSFANVPTLPPPPMMAFRPPPPPSVMASPLQVSIPPQPDFVVCPWCHQPVLRTLLIAHQASKCQDSIKAAPPAVLMGNMQGRGHASASPKDVVKKPRGRPAGSTNKPKDPNNLKSPPKLKKSMKTPMMGMPGGLPPPRPMVMPNQPPPRPMTLPPRPPYMMSPAATGPRPPVAQPPPQVVRDPLTENALGVLRNNLSDPLFATWSSMIAGGLMQSREFWTQVFQAFFAKPTLTPPKWNPLTQWLAGVNVQAFAQPLKPPSKCADSMTFDQVAPAWLAETNVRHTCDSMLQTNGLRCIEPLKPFTHVKHVARDATDSGVLEVIMAAHDQSPLRCRLAIVCAAHAPTDTATDYPGVVWSRFRPNKDCEMPNDAVLPKTPIWVALLSSEVATDFDVGGAYDASVQVADTPIKDDMALETLLCLDVLNEQMKVNRMRWRNLWLKAHNVSAAEVTTATTGRQVEVMYQEYKWWKSICMCLVKGMRDMPFEVDEDTGATLETLQSFEEGTCVICMDGLSEDVNPIIFCDRCDLAMHQRCYGVATIPKSDFYCDRCAAKGPTPPATMQCALCPNPQGAMKQTVDGKWVHLVCALWCPTTCLVKVPRMLFQLTADDTKVRYHSFDILTATCTLADVPNLPAATQPGGLCRICRIATGCTIQCRACPAAYHPLCAWFAGFHMQVDVADCGYICGGGGQGLQFTMFCNDHIPAALPCQDRELQRVVRQQLYKAEVPREPCGVCFRHVSPMYPHHSFDALPTTHYFIRCTECYVQCHAHCVDAPPPSTTTNEPWKCEKCRTLTPLQKPTAIACLLCDQTQGYMIPVQPAPMAVAAPLAAANPALALMPPPPLPPMHSTLPHVHLYCADAFRVSIVKTDKGRAAAPMTAWDPPMSKCTICHKRSGRLVGCWKKHCGVSMHPYCGVKELWFSYKVHGKRVYCCSDHPPDHAVFDPDSKMWITQETLAALQEVRCSLERVRMFVDLSKQREKTKKRMFVNTESVGFEKARQVIVRKAPSATMKTFYKAVTHEALMELPKRKTKVVAPPLAEQPQRKKHKHGSKKAKAKSTSPHRRPSRRDNSDDDEDDDDDEARRQRLEALWSQGIPTDDPDMDAIMTQLYPDECPPPRKSSSSSRSHKAKH